MSRSCAFRLAVVRAAAAGLILTPRNGAVRPPIRELNVKPGRGPQRAVATLRDPGRSPDTPSFDLERHAADCIVTRLGDD